MTGLNKFCQTLLATPVKENAPPSPLTNLVRNGSPFTYGKDNFTNPQGNWHLESLSNGKVRPIRIGSAAAVAS